VLGKKTIFRVDMLDRETCMATADHENLTNSQVSEARPDRRLSREDQLYEAALSLSLGDGIPFTARDYRLLLESLWRTNP
jgi:hypothetical protein